MHVPLNTSRSQVVKKTILINGKKEMKELTIVCQYIRGINNHCNIYALQSFTNYYS